jgi:plastin-1
MNITKTLTSLSKSSRPISDTEMLKWANTTAQKGTPGLVPLRSFKDPSITTGLFFLSLLDAMQPGIVDQSLVYKVSPSGDYEERRQNGRYEPVQLNLFSDASCFSLQLNSRFLLRVRWVL